MYLLPTDKDIARLYDFIDPETRFLLSAKIAINELTKDAMPYFDDIEDDIISMRRDINGFLPYARGTDSVRYKGRTFVTEDTFDEEILKDPRVEHVSSWDEI